MGKSTFSGPLVVGTVRTKDYTDPNSAPADDNTGYAILTKQVTLSSTGTTQVNKTVVIPAGSQILEFYFDVTTAFNGTSTVATVGSAVAGTQYASGVALTAAGRVQPTLTAAQLTAMNSTAADTNSRSSTLNITTTPGAGNNTGTVIVTVKYAQKVDTSAPV